MKDKLFWKYFGFRVTQTRDNKENYMNYEFLFSCINADNFLVTLLFGHCKLWPSMDRVKSSTTNDNIIYEACGNCRIINLLGGYKSINYYRLLWLLPHTRDRYFESLLKLPKPTKIIIPFYDITNLFRHLFLYDISQAF